MATSKENLFDPRLTQEIITKMAGHSTLAKLCQSTPVAFNGNKEFIFSLDKDIDVVAEGGAKSEGGLTLTPVTVIPYKVEYGARVSDEFMYATEEEKIDILSNFTEGFGKKLAVGLDKMAFHGVNPRTGTASTVIGDKHFDKAVKDANVVTYDKTKPDESLEEAINKVGDNDGIVTGIAMANSMRKDMAQLKNKNGDRVYPDFAFGSAPSALGSQTLDVNRTVDMAGKNTDKAIVGDFANMFKWGYAKDVFFKVIEAGDPDNSGQDLAGHNQVYLRCEAYIGWGILDPDSFAIVRSASAEASA